MLLLALLLLLAIFIGLGFVVKWLFVLAVIVALILIAGGVMGSFKRNG